jgi:hypothetical protein
MESIIKIEHLGKSFNTSNSVVTALEEINLDIHKGEIFGIIGLSGAGKSTLVRCINYLEVPTKGDIIFKGKSLSSMHEFEIREVRRSMGMIFQQFNLLAQRNVLRNITFPLELAGMNLSLAKKRAYELLDLVGLSDKAKAYPAQLSGGQKQRVAIARAIANNPKVLLCDEATSALDPNTTNQILELIRNINKEFGITVIIITHEMKVIESTCDRLAIIDEARIAETGKVADVFANPKSKIGKRLILGEVILKDRLTKGRKIRITFDGKSSYEPVVSNMILSAKVAVNILHASTDDVKGMAMGQMLIQLSDEDNAFEKVTSYLNKAGVTYEEVE